MHKLASLVLTMMKIGIIGFGGGNALVPVIEKELVSKGLISKDEFDKEVIVANITPGALPIEIASGAGRVIAGAPGMVLAALGMALPGALLTLALLALFAAAADSAIVQVRFASVGVSMLIVVLLATYAVNAVRSKPAHTPARYVAIGLVLVVFALTCGKKLLKLFGLDATGVLTLSTLDVLGVVFFAIFFTGGRFLATGAHRVKFGIAICLSTLYLLSSNGVGPLAAEGVKPVLQGIMLVLGAWGFIRSFRAESGPSRPFPVKRMAFEVAVWLGFLAVLIIPAIVLCPDGIAFARNAVLSVLMSFGGGDAYLVFGQGVFVDTGMISAENYFEQVVTVSNAMPGSIIAKVLTGVGFFIGANYGPVTAVFMAVGGFACGVGASGITFLVMYYVYERFEPLSVFRAIKRYIRPVIGGLLLTVAVTMFQLNMNVASAFSLNPVFMACLSLVLLAFLFWASNVRELPLSILIVVSIFVGIAACNIAYA